MEIVRSYYSHSSVEIFRSYVKLGVNIFAPTEKQKKDTSG